MSQSGSAYVVKNPCAHSLCKGAIPELVQRQARTVTSAPERFCLYRSSFDGLLLRAQQTQFIVGA